MRLLFVSSTTIGGSGRSQRELAAALIRAGHEVEFLVDPERGGRITRWCYGHLSDLAVRTARTPLRRLVPWMEGVPGRRMTEVTLDGVRHHEAHVPENAAPALIESLRPDVVVGSSIARLAWRKIRHRCDELSIPTVLYLREDVALTHFEGGVRPAGAIVANAQSIARSVVALGIDCAFLPSAIDTSVTATDSTRQVALAINPIESRGVDTVWALAERMPDVDFVLQESWPLEPDQVTTIEARASRLPNVQLRRARPPGPELYGDARVLLVPYRVDNRPRVIAEAQANGIPVLAADVPALVEAIGDGGAAVGLDDIDAWANMLRSWWEDAGTYAEVARRALIHSTRDELAVGPIAETFLGIAARLLDRAETRP